MTPKKRKATIVDITVFATSNRYTRRRVKIQKQKKPPRKILPTNCQYLLKMRVSLLQARHFNNLRRKQRDKVYEEAKKSKSREKEKLKSQGGDATEGGEDAIEEGRGEKDTSKNDEKDLECGEEDKEIENEQNSDMINLIKRRRGYLILILLSPLRLDLQVMTPHLLSLLGIPVTSL